MGTSRKWLKSLRRRFRKSSIRDIIVFRSTDPCPNQELIYKDIGEPREEEEEEVVEEDYGDQVEDGDKFKGKEDAAAIKIQASFRAHLARRAFKALRSLVKLQALARGAYVRKQTQLALHCMHSLVRLQVRIRARQILGGFDLY